MSTNKHKQTLERQRNKTTQRCSGLYAKNIPRRYTENIGRKYIPGSKKEMKK